VDISQKCEKMEKKTKQKKQGLPLQIAVFKGEGW
jgi:hypothetical protein